MLVGRRERRLITSARYFGWFIVLIGALMAAVAGSYLLFGAPEFTFNGELVKNRAQALRALGAAAGIVTAGGAVAGLLQP